MEGHSFTGNELQTDCFEGRKSPEKLARALDLRLMVFVVEQGVPLEEERDGYDETAWHWLITDAHTGEALATARVIAYQEACRTRPVAKIGRVAVRRSQRGRRLGETLMRNLLQTIREMGYEQSILDAQAPVVAFYEKLGFVVEGDAFEEAGILHYRMRLVV